MLQSAAEAVVESSTDSVEPSTDFGCTNGFISSSLALFDHRLQTILSTDAAHYALGAVLTQIAEQGTEQTVAFASRSLSEAERKYSIVEKEVLVLASGLQKVEDLAVGQKVNSQNRPSSSHNPPGHKR